MKKLFPILLVSCLAIVAVVLIRGFSFSTLLPVVSEEKLRQSVMSAIQRESSAQFYVTGTLDLSTTVVSSSDKTLLPEILAIDLGTTTSSVSIPGRASYGFDVRGLRPESITLEGDSVLRVRIPQLAVHLVEPRLAGMEVITKAGWARMGSRSGKRMERKALEATIPAMRAQAEAHIATALQPKVNTEQALQALLRPVLVAARLEDCEIRF